LHQHFTNKHQASLGARVAVLGCARGEDERVMIPFLQVPFVPAVAQGVDT